MLITEFPRAHYGISVKHRRFPCFSSPFVSFESKCAVVSILKRTFPDRHFDTQHFAIGLYQTKGFAVMVNEDIEMFDQCFCLCQLTEPVSQVFCILTFSTACTLGDVNPEHCTDGIGTQLNGSAAGYQKLHLMLQNLYLHAVNQFRFLGERFVFKFQHPVRHLCNFRFALFELLVHNFL